MLSTASAEVVRATLPVVRDHAVEITGVFYRSLFAAHPELLDLFNQGNQAGGRQRVALASAVLAYADHLLDPGGAPFDAIAARVAHKHVSLGVRAEQYPVVGRHLSGAVAEVLGAAVTPAVAAAWDEVYRLLADALSAAEARLYRRGGIDPAAVWRDWRVVERRDEAVDAVSFTLAPDDGGPVPHFTPGQYVSVAVDLPGGRRQPRQYSLSRAPRGDALRITVRRVRGTGGAPDGVVSGHLHDHVRADDTLLVGPPAGEHTLDDGTSPVLLISAGIGITPMVSMLEHVARTQPSRRVVVAHGERSPERHALRAEVAGLVRGLADAELRTWYEDAPGGGLVDVAALPLPADATAHLCGPVPFMRHVRAGLLRRGVPDSRIRYEVFGPGMLDTPFA
ncbi:globin domain-containing protein [Saccharothrix australiensis]|uniref:nitric oxide dioxygenase n=1 Tax=Saccharothrix australiensis TaxID=2072 RepID=A0A495W0Y2_9PSEU|nr:globin domain-containing protein [Saccharothrix australiensis]RKT55276.1 nitric oxide dioxygenase [Saccharothrix australiensis]